jgi:hypothetical protein
LDDIILVTEQYLAEWGVESFNEQSFQWLGEGLDEGFRGFFWSENETEVRLILHLIPGPSREDPTRRLSVKFGRYGYYEDDKPIEKVLEFSYPTQYEMEVTLSEGMNVLDLAALDEADIEVLPNGDTRPLLVQLVKLEVLPIDE